VESRKMLEKAIVLKLNEQVNKKPTGQDPETP
jgi:hypothetical protein